MRPSLISPLLALLSPNLAAHVDAGLVSRALSTDNSCGLNNGGPGYTCNPNLAGGGPCCSANGWCGSSADYCGTGCQSAYGSCGSAASSSSSTTSTSTMASSSSHSLTPDNSCGTNNGGKGYTCNPNLANGGSCCSASGWCGNGDAYCGAGCQSGFGSCNSAVSSSSSSTSTKSSTTSTRSTSTSSSTTTKTSISSAKPSAVLSPDNSCGLNNNGPGYTCDPYAQAGGSCCSANGFCGNGNAYCGTGCQSAYGVCGAAASVTTSANGPVRTGSTTTCGPAYGNAICKTGLCCSPGGYCGKGSDYCTDPDCQYNYGTCDSDTTPAGTSTINDPRPQFGSVTYTDDIYDCVQDNVVALTYDDGPLNYTNDLLDILDKYGFKATFFMTGNNLGKGEIDTTAPYPSVIKRMYTEGHQVASHTWSHYDLSTLTSPQRIQQMVKNERAIANIIGRYPTYMRPPYSSCDQPSGCWADMQKLGYHRTYFDLDTQDYLNDSPSLIQNSKDIVRWALGNATQGSDFLSIQHDIHQQSVTNLSSYYFDLIKAKGWRGVTVGECLGDPVANWYRYPGTGAAAGGSGNGSGSGPISLSTSLATTKTISPTPTNARSTTTTPSQKFSTTSPAARAASCDVSSGKFCGRIQAFSSSEGCRASWSDCKAQSEHCAAQGGSRGACARWIDTCQRLESYCLKCGSRCSDKGFRASEE